VLARGVLRSAKAKKAWRKVTCKLRWLIRIRRLWGHLGNHLKEYKAVKSK
jgi:hypothetical protein